MLEGQILTVAGGEAGAGGEVGLYEVGIGGRQAEVAGQGKLGVAGSRAVDHADGGNVDAVDEVHQQLLAVAVPVVIHGPGIAHGVLLHVLKGHARGGVGDGGDPLVAGAGDDQYLILRVLGNGLDQLAPAIVNAVAPTGLAAV